MKKAKFDQICERRKLDMQLESYAKLMYAVLESEVNQAY